MLTKQSCLFKNNIIISAIYQLPNKSLAQFTEIFTTYLDLIDSHCKSNSTVFVCGDFKADLLHIDTNLLISAFEDIVYIYSPSPTIHWPT